MSKIRTEVFELPRQQRLLGKGRFTSLINLLEKKIKIANFLVQKFEKLFNHAIDYERM